MFYYISGKLALLEPNLAVLDVGGIGYKLTVSGTTYDTMPPNRSVKEPPLVLLYTHFAVREDDVELFGFYDKDELESFKLLTSISGVGPKVALAILSAVTPSRLAGDAGL